LQAAKLINKKTHWLGTFYSMASQCEILLDTKDEKLAWDALQSAQKEAIRIEQKYSRYKSGNIIDKINTANGERVTVDEETARLLDYAQQCFNLSDGAFDITSGVLRKAWKFDGSNNIPDQKIISKIMNQVGWEKVEWKNPKLRMLPGMQLDFGGIGKEYAVDRTAAIIAQHYTAHVLVNFGGDISVAGPRENGEAWEIGLQNPEENNATVAKVALKKGAVATSGDLNRFLLKNGKRYTHILNPKTGWPIKNAPRQVTVLANTCIDAGMLSTFAILQGAEAEEFLIAQDVDYRIIT